MARRNRLFPALALALAAAGVQAERTSSYLVRLHGEGLVAPAAGKTTRGAPATAAARALAARQDAAFAALASKQARLLRRYAYAGNLLLVRMSAREAARWMQDPRVAAVSEDRHLPLGTDAGPHWIGADVLYGGAGAPPERLLRSGFETGEFAAGTRGAGTVIGVIDSGINFTNPAFSALASDGYRHVNPLGSGVFLGHCDPAHPGYRAGNRCNDKLIGGYDFVHAHCSDASEPCGPAANWLDEPEFSDNDGHGSHTAGTAAGNPFPALVFGVPHAAAGVAPRANLLIYDVCYRRPTGAGLCPSSSLVAAVEQAIADGVVDVLSVSISGGEQPWNDAVELAFLNASAAGIVVAAAAGNAGPGPGQVQHGGPWTLTVAALSHDRAVVDAALELGERAWPATQAASPPSLPADGITAPLAVAPGDGLACSALPSGALAGALALIPRGGCAFSDKINHAADAGALAVLIGNDQPGAPVMLGQTVPHRIPAAMLDRAGAAATRAALRDGGTARLRPTGQRALRDAAWGDVLAGFSSRGPARVAVLKPNLGAPGVAIVAPLAGEGEHYGLLSGTSMATPHVAGAAALLRGLRPQWSPAELASALQLSARYIGVLDHDGRIEPDALQIGSGRIRVDLAAQTGLVLDETAAAFAAANPAAGGDPRQLNLPNFIDSDCPVQCTWQRRLRSAQHSSQSWQAQLQGLPGTLAPTQFTLAAAAEQALTLAVDARSLPAAGWAHGRVLLTPAGNGAPLSMPVAVYVPPPALRSQPTTVQFSLPAGARGEFRLTLRNAGGGQLDWRTIAAATTTVLQQTVDLSSGGTIAGSFEGEQPPAGHYAADDHVPQQAQTLRRVRARGDMIGAGNARLEQRASRISLVVYASSGTAGAATPASHPEAQPEAALYRCERSPGQAGLGLSGPNNATISFEFGGDGCPTPPPLSAGTRYWLAVYPSIRGDSGSRRWYWNWAGSNATDAPHRFIAPTGLFGGPAQWTVASGTGAQAYALQIDADIGCGAAWLDSTPQQGQLGAGAEQTVQLRFDASALPPGRYRADYCLRSNDPALPDRVIPIQFDVSAD